MKDAHCLLSTAARGKSLGRQKARLEELVGGLPRTKNVVLWWKKRIAAVISKRKRKLRVSQRLRDIEFKHTERKARRELREREQGKVILPDETCMSSMWENRAAQGSAQRNQLFVSSISK